MDRVLSYKPHLRVEPAGGGLVFLVGELERFLLQGSLYEQVAPLVDGRRTEWEIVAALDGKVSPPEVLYAIAMLEQRGYLREAVPRVAPEVAAFWDTLGIDPAQAVERLAAAPVAIVAMDGSPPEPLAEALAGAGIAVESDAALRLVVVGDYLDPALAALNRRALADRSSWLPVKPGGAAPWIGPMLRPFEGPCWECVAQRLRINRPVETYLERRLQRARSVAAPLGALPTSRRATLDLAALTLARWIVEGGRGAVNEKLLALDVRKLRLDEHAVGRQPQCPACGDPGLQQRQVERPVRLEPRPKRFTADGGYRAVEPEVTFARYEHLISPVTGVVTSLGPVDGRDHPLRPVYGSAFFLSPPPDGPVQFEDFSRPCMGKGRTAAQSRTGALCEAIERHSAVFRGDEPRVRARLSDLGGEAIDPRTLLCFSDTQYRERTERNRSTREIRQIIPLPFDEGIAIEWTPVWSLTRDARRYLPTAYCYLHVPVAPEERFCELNPNGHAAGNCLEEAVLQGFFELCERDAVGIYWYNRARRPAVDLASFEERYFLDLVDHYRTLGYQLWVLDITTDLEIPAFVALAHDPTTNRWTLGLGCHTEAKLGVQRALTELNQVFDPRSTRHAPWGEQPMADGAFLFPDEGAPAKIRADYPTARRTADLRADVMDCVGRAARLGMETLVLDQTRLDVGLPVVKVTVPGLRHMWPRLGPGRLYEVPMRLGWLRAQHHEAELNPTPLYL